jgi:hypothetical protein
MARAAAERGVNLTFVLDTPLGGSASPSRRRMGSGTTSFEPSATSSNDPQSGVRLVKALVEKNMLAPEGCVVALEVGNEPDSYWDTHPATHITTVQQYEVGGRMCSLLSEATELQRSCFGRDPVYSKPLLLVYACQRLLSSTTAPMPFPNLGQDAFSNFTAAYMAAGLPAHRIQGATFATLMRAGFDASVPRLMEAFHPVLHSLSLHDYPTTTCLGLTVRIAELASRASSHGAAELYRPFVQAGEKHGVPLVIGEANSASCGGQANVSNAMIAALWAVDYLASMSQVGAAGVNFHGTGFNGDARPYYAPYVFASNGTPLARPLYYGLLAYAELVAGVNTTWLSISVRHVSGYPTFPNTAAHATVADAGKVIRLTIVSKETHGTAAHVTANVTVVLGLDLPPACPGKPATTASLVRLQNRNGSLGATSNLTYAGQTFDGSDNGLPIGQKVTEHVPVRLTASGAEAVLRVSPAEAVTLTVVC